MSDARRQGEPAVALVRAPRAGLPSRAPGVSDTRVLQGEPRCGPGARSSQRERERAPRVLQRGRGMAPGVAPFPYATVSAAYMFAAPPPAPSRRETANRYEKTAAELRAEAKQNGLSGIVSWRAGIARPP